MGVARVASTTAPAAHTIATTSKSIRVETAEAKQKMRTHVTIGRNAMSAKGSRMIIRTLKKRRVCQYTKHVW